MKIGIPKEIKNNENRVGMTPAGVAELVKHGHQVMVQHTAGEGSGFADEDYVAVGAEILPTIEDVYASADMIVYQHQKRHQNLICVKRLSSSLLHFHLFYFLIFLQEKHA